MLIFQHGPELTIEEDLSEAPRDNFVVIIRGTSTQARRVVNWLHWNAGARGRPRAQPLGSRGPLYVASRREAIHGAARGAIHGPFTEPFTDFTETHHAAW